MTINEIKQSFNTAILDGDIISKTNFLFIDDENIVNRNGKKINLGLKLEWPIIRIISNDYFILVDRDSSSNKKINAWIINTNGTIESSFYIGNALDLIVTQNGIVTSYSKCSLDTSRIFSTTYRSPNYVSDIEEASSKKFIHSEGLAVFDFKGNCLFKYMSDSRGKNFIPFKEIYSFLKKDENTIYLLADLFEGGFTILEFSLNNYNVKKKQNLKEIIPKNHLPRAMTKIDNTWYFLMINFEEMEKGDLDNLKTYLFKMKNTQILDKVGECCFSVKMHGNLGGSFSILLGIHDIKRSPCYLKI
ncbi:hypothetical protein [Aureibacter tunicatorum]|uniref:Uncharacterized protein n=1 Tax=Aureibacter tunicatorum TaxID=866807 RepID=A0AAE3XSA7_9BACT|nr:hypothetical protein [Aureibacter tunicatorum]MDR6241109.1 hypothetical protein [Aureibacter tunicatorum]BDD03887.1 hypothetical protein AUTU_13700 [Aureibacter tunicatorum]